MYYCEQCGREIKKKIRYGGYTLCSKHMHQLHKYGKFLDNIQRTANDLNDYVIVEDTAIFNLYNQKNIKVGEFVIDKEDLEKIKYKKWRISHNHVVTGQPYNMDNSSKKCRDITHILLNISPDDDEKTVIDYKDGNGFNNKKENLRICSQGENTKNKSFTSNNTSGFIGVSYRKDRNVWCPEIRNEYKRWHLGQWKIKKEAVYARLVAEKFLFKEFANEKEATKKEKFTESLSSSKKQEIESYVLNKLKT